MKQNLINAFAILLMISGCSPVKFYSDAGLSRPAGLKYYTVKPYLVVDRESSTGNIVKTSVIYLPDLENPQYLVMKDGIGSRKADLKLENGSISNISIATDAGVPEAIGSLADLTDKTAEAIKDIASMKGTYPGAAQSTLTELYEFIMNNNVTSVRKIDIK